MAGLFFRRVLLRRSQFMGSRLRAMRRRLARKRRLIRGMRRTLEVQQLAAAEMEVVNRRIREENELLFMFNILADQWVRDRLAELEDP